MGGDLPTCLGTPCPPPLRRVVPSGCRLLWLLASSLLSSHSEDPGGGFRASGVPRGRQRGRRGPEDHSVHGSLDRRAHRRGPGTNLRREALECRGQRADTGTRLACLAHRSDSQEPRTSKWQSLTLPLGIAYVVKITTARRLGSRDPCPDRILAGRVRRLPDLVVEIREVTDPRPVGLTNEVETSGPSRPGFRLMTGGAGQRRGCPEVLPTPDIRPCAVWLLVAQGSIRAVARAWRTGCWPSSVSTLKSCRTVPATASAELAVTGPAGKPFLSSATGWGTHGAKRRVAEQADNKQETLHLGILTNPQMPPSLLCGEKANIIRRVDETPTRQMIGNV